jgi:hypothetical protein
MLDKFIASQPKEEVVVVSEVIDGQPDTMEGKDDDVILMEDRTKEEIKKAEEEVDLYNIKNFSI